MGSGSFQIIVLLVLAVVIFIRLSKELGKRDGHEPTLTPREPNLKLVKNAPIEDAVIVEEIDDAEISKVIEQAKEIEPSFRLDQFLQGSKSAYELIFMSFLKGDVSGVKSFVDQAVYESFEEAIKARVDAGHRVEASFIGIKDVKLKFAEFDKTSKELVLGVEYVSNLNRVIYDAKDKIIEGTKNKIETEVDHWQFARIMGSVDPNWELIATGE